MKTALLHWEDAVLISERLVTNNSRFSCLSAIVYTCPPKWSTLPWSWVTRSLSVSLATTAADSAPLLSSSLGERSKCNKKRISRNRKGFTQNSALIPWENVSEGMNEWWIWGFIYIYKNYKLIDILTLLTSWGLSLLSSEISNSEVSFLWFFFLEVIVFFFLLSNLSKNLIPLQKQHPRSVGNRPKKRKSMPYSIILGLGWASSRCSSCSLIPFQNSSSLRIAFGSRNVGVMMIQWEFLTKPDSKKNIYCSDGRGMLEIGHFLGPVCWDRSVTRERVLKKKKKLPFSRWGS